MGIVGVPVMLGVSMLDNSTSECICFVLDMTKQKQAEAQLLRAKEDVRRHGRSR